MVVKLLKHEFIALGRILVPVALVVLALSGISSLSLYFGANNVNLLQTILIGLFFLGIAVIMSVSYWVCIKRFHDSIFSKQGYMTLSLPVTSLQLLAAKTIAAAAAIIFSFLVVIASAELFAVMHQVDILGLIVETLIWMEVDGGLIIYALLVALCQMISLLLFIYACIAAGQRVNRNRIALSILAYLVITQVLSIITSFFTANITNVYVLLTISLGQSLVIGAASVAFVCYILKNKVNLLA